MTDDISLVRQLEKFGGVVISLNAFLILLVSLLIYIPRAIKRNANSFPYIECVGVYLHKEDVEHCMLDEIWYQTDQFAKLTVVDQAHREYLRFGALSLALSKTTLSGQALVEAFALRPKDAPTNFLLGKLALELGDYSSAITYWQNVEKVDQVLLAWAKSDITNGDYETASTKLEILTQINPAFRDGHYWLGYVYEQLNRIDDAITVYHNALKVNQFQDSNLFFLTQRNLGFVYSEQQRWVAASELLSSALRIESERPDVWAELAWTEYHIDNDIAVAEYRFQKAIDLQPNNGHIYFLAYSMYLHEAQWDQAIRWCNQAEQYFGETAIWATRKGVVFYNMGKLEYSLSLFEKAIQLDLEIPQAYYWAGLAASKLGDDNDAFYYASQGIEIAPDSLEIHLLLVSLYEKNMRYEEAFSECEIVLELDPDNAQCERILGRIKN